MTEGFSAREVINIKHIKNKNRGSSSDHKYSQ